MAWAAGGKAVVISSSSGCGGNSGGSSCGSPLRLRRPRPEPSTAGDEPVSIWSIAPLVTGSTNAGSTESAAVCVPAKATGFCAGNCVFVVYGDELYLYPATGSWLL